MRTLSTTYIAAVLLFLFAPLLVVIGASFSPGGVAEFPPSGFSLRWYGVALAEGGFLGSLINSLVIGFIAAACAGFVGTAAAFSLMSSSQRVRGLLLTVFMSPLLVPGIVIGIALLAAFTALGWRDAMSRLIVGHVLVTFPYVVRTVSASFAQFNPIYAEAASTLGATRIRVFWHVILPAVLPGIFAGTVFAFIMSFDNVPISMFLTDSATTTLPIAIMSYIEYNPDPAVAAISSMIVLISLCLALLIERLFGLRKAVAG
jgi:putative spermidine/putrescine transport system permease protein